MSTVLVTGANRGIGLEFARQYHDAGWEVIATCRRPEQVTELGGLGVTVERLDVSRTRDIAELARALGDRPIDLIVNNAGLYGSRQTFGDVDETEWLDVIRVNTIAPLKLAEGFIANLKAAGNGVVACISSRMGSIADNSGGGVYAYRSSKAALNMVVKSLSIDLSGRGVTVVALHPGWVKTRMGGTGAALSPAESVQGMRQVIAGLDISQSGRFYAYNGEEIPW